MLTNVKQWILPAINCAGPFTVECRIQKSRTPWIDNVRGIYDGATTYYQNDIVYYNNSSYPGWRWKNPVQGNTTPAIGANWEYASNFDFTQSDNTTVFYLDQQIISESGLGSIQRHVSRQEGKLTPDVRELGLLDCTKYSGHYGDGTLESGDLSTGDYRTLLNRIFEDPDALYTIFFSKVSGSARELYFIGDADYSKATSDYNLDYKPGTTDALQMLLTKIQAEGCANRLNTFTVKDLLATITLNDMNATDVPFIGGYVNLGCEHGALTTPLFDPTVNLEDNVFSAFGGVSPHFYHSRTFSRVNGTVPFVFLTTGQGLMVASTSVNDKLSFMLITTLISKISQLVNDTYSNADLQSLMSFWADMTDQTTGIITSIPVGIDSIGFPFEYLFNVDPRCYFGVAEYDMGGFSWDTTLSDVLVFFCNALITYTQGTYDQTNKRGQLTLADALSPKTTALPTNWIPGEKAGAKPRAVSAKAVRVQNKSDSDIVACPNKKVPAITKEIGPRVKNLGRIGATQGVTSVDLIYNGNLTQEQQYVCWSPMSGGLGEGGHIRRQGTVGGSGPAFWTLEDRDAEFVLVQGATQGRFYVKNDKYGHPTAYCQIDGPQGRADPIMFANGAYGCVNYKYYRNNLSFVIEPTQGGVTGSIAPPTGTGVEYRIGYVGFRMDLQVFDNSEYVYSPTADWTNNFATGELVVGQQIVIPARGVFTCVETGLDRNHVADIHWMKLDRVIDNDGTGLEVLVGGPQPNAESFLIGTYLYFYNNGFKRFSAACYGDDSADGTESAFYPRFWLNKYSTDAEGNWYGCYALSRMRYVDGDVYDGVNPPDDSFGNSLKTTAQCHASLNLGSFSVVSRPFIGSLTDAGTLTGYDPQDTWTEHAQGAPRTYRATGLNIDEKHGTVVSELLESTGLRRLSDKNFPIRKVGKGSSGSSGSSGGSLGGAGGGNNTNPNTSFGWASQFTPTQLVQGNNNDVDYTKGSIAVQEALAAAATLTGIMNSGSGTYRSGFSLKNTSGFPIIIANNSSLSVAGNRILTGTGADIALANNDIKTFVYDADNAVWNIVAGGTVASDVSENLAVSAGTTNDFPISSYTKVIRLTAAGAAILTGLTNGVDLREIEVWNVGTNQITLSGSNVLSSAANRFLWTGQGANPIKILGANSNVVLRYDGTTARWRLISGPT